jgi:hypothetical protein
MESNNISNGAIGFSYVVAFSKANKESDEDTN